MGGPIIREVELLENSFINAHLPYDMLLVKNTEKCYFD